MNDGAKVKMRGVVIGHVRSISLDAGQASLQVDLNPDQVKYIPANVDAQIRATTAFGAKYVDLIYPEHPSQQQISPGTVLRSRNVSTEVNTVFQNLVGVLRQIDPAKLQAVLGALADGVRGQGERIGQATTDADVVLNDLNARSDTIAEDWHSLAGFSDAYARAAPDILSTLDSVSTISQTISAHGSPLDELLLNTIGMSNSGIELLGSSTTWCTGSTFCSRRQIC